MPKVHQYRNPHNLQRQQPQQQQTPLEILDLHGKTKSKAIASLTMFLSECVRKHQQANIRSGESPKSQEGVWVRVITGTGKHSRDGPILRLAVQATLQKREMEYKLDKGKGAFLIRADSGFELFKEDEGRMPNSKLEVISHESLRAHAKTSGNSPPSSKSILTEPVSVVTTSLCSSNDPLPHQVQQDDENLEKVKELSLIEQKTDTQSIQKAISASKLTHQLESAIMEHEDQILKDVLETSAYEEEVINKQEQRMIDQALSFSLVHELRIDQQEEDLIQQAIAASLKYHHYG